MCLQRKQPICILHHHSISVIVFVSASMTTNNFIVHFLRSLPHSLTHTQLIAQPNSIANIFSSIIVVNKHMIVLNGLPDTLPFWANPNTLHSTVFRPDVIRAFHSIGTYLAEQLVRFFFVSLQVHRLDRALLWLSLSSMVAVAVMMAIAVVCPHFQLEYRPI